MKFYEPGDTIDKQRRAARGRQWPCYLRSSHNQADGEVIVVMRCPRSDEEEKKCFGFRATRVIQFFGSIIIDDDFQLPIMDFYDFCFRSLRVDPQNGNLRHFTHSLAIVLSYFWFLLLFSLLPLKSLNGPSFLSRNQLKLIIYYVKESNHIIINCFFAFSLARRELPQKKRSSDVLNFFHRKLLFLWVRGGL